MTIKNTLLVVLGLLSIFLISACGSRAPADIGGSSPVPTQAVPAPGFNPDDVVETVVVSDGSGDIVVDEPESGVKEFRIIAKQWEFIPRTIEVNQGDQVRLVITSVDVAHGYAIPGYGINERLIPGRETIIEFTADKKGTFTPYCSVSCGAGHSSMRGTLIVN